MNRYIIGITGASGSILAKRLLEFLSSIECELNVVATEPGKKVFLYETGIRLDDFIKTLQSNAAIIILHDNADLFATVASGSYETDCMFIAPCSMSTAGKISNGLGDNLLCRAADVCLKERTRLVLVPRETPLNSIHIRNLLALSESGAIIVPPVPMFYTKSETIEAVYDGIVGRILKSACIKNTLYKEWRQV